MSESRNDSAGTARFAFGSMALDEELGRAPNPSQSNNLASEDHEEQTLNEATDVLRMVVLNEQFSPELLPFQTDAIQVLRQLVNQQTELVDAEEDQAAEQVSFELQLKRMELDRVNYLLRQYYRLRLSKIEKFVFFIFKDDASYELLSESERVFAKGYSDLLEEHFNKSFLSILPQRLQIIEKDGAVDHARGPQLDRFVFCRVKNSVGRYAVGEDDTEDAFNLERGDVLCIRYKGVHELLKNEDIELT